MKNNSSIIRTHDHFYANSDPMAPPKDTFIQIGKLIGAYKEGAGVCENISIADIGCATGAFVSYLSKEFPGANIVGYEYLDSLIKAGNIQHPSIEIRKASVLNRADLPKSGYDIITLLGVLSIFDDVYPVISNLIYWTKPGGKIFMHGMFNPYDVDVYVKYRKSENFEDQSLESGWNIISQNSLERLLTKLGAKDIKFHQFKISVDLKKNKDDQLRSWTEFLQDGDRQIINGLCIKQPQYIVEIDV